ncbi:WD40-repeat-containing domain protein [Paraphysoderma sedebokerense]|nr:WD40-repeat-containing domain protein [Paraphysoderma sedebokerense]
MRNNWMNGRSKNLTFSGHEHNVVTCLQFDDEKIVSGSDDQSIRIYDIRTGDLIRVLEGHAGGVWALQYVGNTLVSGSTDRTVRIWDMSTGRCTHVFHGHTSTVRCLQIIEPSPVPSSSLSMNRKTGYAVSSTYLAPPVKNSPSFPIIVTGSRDATLRVWKLPNPEKDSPYLASEHSDESGSSNPYFIRTLSGHGHSVRALAGHGNIVCSGSYDCTVRVWDIAQGECLWRLTGHSQKVYSIVYDGVSKCWSGSMDASVRCWDVTTGQCLAVLDGHASLVGLLELTPKHLISAAADASLRIWSTEDNSLQSTLQAHNGAITCFQFDNYKVISGSEGHIKLWDLKSGKVVRDLVSGVNGVWRLRCDERWLVSAVQRNGRTEFVVMDFDVGEDEALAADGSSSGVSSRNRAVVNSNGAVTSIGDFVWPEDNESVHDEDQENHEEEEDMDAMDHDGEDEEEDELTNLGVEIDVDAINSINEFGDDGLEADELAD